MKLKSIKAWLFRIAGVRRSKPAHQDGMLKELLINENTTKMTMQHPGFVYLINEMVGWFKNSGGINFCAMSAYHPDVGMFEVTFQRIEGKTPSIIINELKDENKKLKFEIEKLRADFA